MGKVGVHSFNFIDMTGWVMKEHGVLDSRLTVIKCVGRNKGNRALWLCKCECGNEIIVDGALTRKNNTKSCGCKKLEESKNNGFANRGKRKKFNTFVFNDDDTVCGFDDKGNSFLIDKDDYEAVSKYVWHKTKGGYWMTVYSDEPYKQTHLKLHKLVTRTSSTELIDHVNRDKNDNRKCNLRVCDLYENARNSSIAKNNTSGFIGVSYNKQRKEWKASIHQKSDDRNRTGGKELFLGWYKNKEDAIVARLKGELKYFGKDFAPQRHLFKQYGIMEDSE